MSNILAPDDVANMTALLPIHGDDNGDNNDDGDDALVVDMGDYNDEDVESILRQLMNRSKHFQKVIDIGHERKTHCFVSKDRFREFRGCRVVASIEL
jgi:hypothetical protein